VACTVGPVVVGYGTSSSSVIAGTVLDTERENAGYRAGERRDGGVPAT